ncbi:MAG TPA: type II toxin-antitoxin system VapC family toxin [Stellaceae bacterium]
MTPVVLDASAIIALLRNEPGWERVEAVLANAAISTVNLAEVVGYLTRTGATEDNLRAMLYLFSVQVVPFDEAGAYDAGRLVQVTRPAGLSLGARACLALVRRLGGSAMPRIGRGRGLRAQSGSKSK